MRKAFLIVMSLMTVISSIHATEDTTRVRQLLQLSEYYLSRSGKDGNDKMLDSALSFASSAETLSTGLKYNKGLESSYLNKIRILLRMRQQKPGSGQQETTLLQQVKTAQDRVIRLVESQGEPKKTAELYMTLAEQFSSDPDDLKEKIDLYKQAAVLFNKLKDKENEAIALFQIGDAYIDLSDLENSEKYLQESLAASKIAGKKDLQILYSTLGIVYTFQGELAKGLEYGLEAEKTAEALKDTSGYMSKLYNYIGVTYEGAKNWKKSIEYYKKALKEEEKHGDISLINSIASNIAKITSLTDPKSSVLFIEDIMKKYPLPAEDDANIRIIIRCMIDYTRLKDTVAAQRYCDQLMAISDKLPSADQMQMVIYSPVTKFLVNTNQFETAAKYLAAYEKAATKANVPAFLKEIAWRNYQVDSSRGNFVAAIKHFKRYYAINDSLFSVAKTKQFSELQIKYDTEKKDNALKFKDNEIKLNVQNILLLTRAAALRQKDFEKDRLRFQYDSLSGKQALLLVQSEASKKDNDLLIKQQDIGLLKKESQLQQVRLTESKVARNFIIAGAAMLLLLLALGYNRYRVKQKATVVINSKNLELGRLVEEKEWLLKEIHHRVKNNLQTVVSLLESQSAYLQNSEAQLAIQDSQNRVHAMSLIHQKLYQSDNVATINMAVYLPELASYLKDSFSVKQHIRFDLQISPLELDVSQAVPTGLILNEAITNSIKYAFTDRPNGNIITIIMRQRENKMVELIVADNGKGLPAGFEHHHYDGLGLKLMKGLTGDIEGNFSIRSEGGTSISVSFMANTPFNKISQVKLPALTPQIA